MTEFWNSLLTQKSWDLLTKIAREPFKFILIGGWAVYLWTNLHKSKDIDIALPDIKEIDYLKKNYDLKKNHNLKKYEITLEEIDIDIYVPYSSKLPIPVEDLKEYSVKTQGLTVLKPSALLVLKQAAEMQREDSVKGIKDRIDVMSLLCFGEPDLKLYSDILKRYGLESYLMRLKKIVGNFTEHNYLNMNPRELKLKKKDTLQKL